MCNQNRPNKTMKYELKIRKIVLMRDITVYI